MIKTDTVARFSLIFARKVHFSENSSVRENFRQNLAETTEGGGTVGRTVRRSRRGEGHAPLRSHKLGVYFNISLSQIRSTSFLLWLAKTDPK